MTYFKVSMLLICFRDPAYDVQQILCSRHKALLVIKNPQIYGD